MSKPVPKISSCTDLLAWMVSFDTVNAYASGRVSREAQLVAALERWAIEAGLQAKRLPVTREGCDLLLTQQVNATAPWLLLVSHMDTVETTGMTIDPLAGSVVDGRLYGRGACDTKGSGAAMLWAAEQYLVKEAKANNVAVLFTVDEECHKTGIRTFLQEHLAQLDFRPSAAVVGEPTSLRPVVAHNGVVRWAIRTEGVAAHSSDPTQGRSAISMMARVVEAIESRYIAKLSASHPLTGPAACSINLIRGGTQINIIPAECEIQLDRRIVPGEDPKTVLDEVEGVLDELRRADKNLRVTQDEPFIDPALASAGGEAFVALVGTVLRKMGLSGEATGARFGTEASDLSAAGIPAVVLGPGDIAQAHSANEWIALDELDQAVQFYLSMMSTRLPTTEEPGDV